MTAALTLLQQSLAAAEPGRDQNQLLISDDNSRVRVIAIPDQVRAIPHLIATVHEEHGMREPGSLESVRDVNGLRYFALSDYTYRTSYFSGADVKLDGAVGTGKVVYAPGVGHIPDYHDRHYPELVGRPGAVVYPGYVYVHVHVAGFGSALKWLVKQNAVSGATDLDYESSWIGNKFALVQRTVTGKPKITEKSVAKLTADTEALKQDFSERVHNLIQVCNRFREYNAIKAFKLEPIR